MRISLEWLAEVVALPPREELIERLSTGGFEDVAIEDTGPDLAGVVVGHVAERSQHPGADRLSLCRVDPGGGEIVEVVCGASNVAAGQKIAFAPVGTRLPDGTKLKKSKIRGVTSRGMICSSRELGLGDDPDGILVLDPGAEVGAPLSDAIPTGQRILEVGITPNRGDTASVLGLAREVTALFGGELHMPDTSPLETGASSSDAISISIEAPGDCHQYVGRVVRGVRVGASPEWVRQRLEASGIRAVNNVVDVTNLVLLERGQPLHAFDLATLGGAKVRVRRAAAGEKLLTLDGETRELDPRDLIIADATRPIAIAGVMGGADTEVGDATRDVLIESAHFHPTTVRRGARRHGLHSEASYRFERGIDREGVRLAADRAARLLAELAGGEVATGAVQVYGRPPEVSEEVSLEVERANRVLGTSISPGEVVALLGRVGVACEVEGPVVRGRVPSWRNDLHGPHDLTEEVARIFGYDRIPTTEPVAHLRQVEEPVSWRLAEAARDALAASGLVECVTLPFVGADDPDRLRLPEDDPRRVSVVVVNPIIEAESRLRTTLVASLLRLVRQNRSRQIDRVAIFEVARVFRPEQGSPELPSEPLTVSAVLTAGQEPHLWAPAEPPPLFFQAKDVVKRLVKGMGYVATLRGGSTQPYLHPGAASTIEVGKHVVGSVGELHPEVAGTFEVDVPCALLELDLSVLCELPAQLSRFREVSRQPRVQRDLAVVVDARQPAGEVLEAITKAAGKDLVSAELFDRYEGRGVPEGRVSLAFRLVFQRPDRTLKDSEVASATDRVVRMLAHRFGGELR